MTRLVPLLILFLLLTGCSLAPDEYLYVEPHVDSSMQIDSSDALTAENYMGLKNAILRLIRTGKTEGVIHVTNYDGDVEKDLPEAAYAVSKQDPLGAYAVDYMTHSCTQIVSYYEIRISITFRRTAEEIAGILSASTQERLEERVTEALQSYDDRLTVRISNYRDQAEEIPAFVADYCNANPQIIIEQPTVAVSVYPESGNVRILEINFEYTHEPQELASMQRSVFSSINGAAEYIRYRETDQDKAALLFTYLTERFHYMDAQSNTPLYDALCRGIADPTGLAQAWQSICDHAGMECYTVSGLRNGEPYDWNIISADGVYRHVDLARNVLETHELLLLADGDMAEYYWNIEQYPACEAPEETPEEPPTEEPPVEDDPSVEENPPVEEDPPTEEPPAEDAPPAQEEPPADPLEPDVENPTVENPPTEPV